MTFWALIAQGCPDHLKLASKCASEFRIAVMPPGRLASSRRVGLQALGRVPDGLHRGGVAVEFHPGFSPYREQQ